MSQPLAGTFTQLGQKTKNKARRRVPGPEWQEALLISKGQLALSGIVAIAEAAAGIAEGNPVKAASFVYNGYLLVKGAHNYIITSRSAEKAPLRELLGNTACANDNLLTQEQSISNSCTLLSRTFAAMSLSTLVNFPYQVGVSGLTPRVLIGSALSVTSCSSAAILLKKIARSHGTPRMPGITGKLPGVS